MKHIVRNVAQSEAGASLVEFALLAPVFILLLVGVIEVGRYAHFAILAAGAARAGVEYGAQSTATAGDITGMRNAAKLDAQDVATGSPAPLFTASPRTFCELQNGTATPCPTASGSPPPSNLVYFVEVDTSGTFQPLLKYPGIPQSVPISGKAVMRVTNQ